MELTFDNDWQDVLATEFDKPYFASLIAFLDQERQRHTVYPPAEDVFAALRLTPLQSVRVVVLGQDPYHDDNQAHGLSFSVRPGIKPPPSLRNMMKELKDDIGVDVDKSNGFLVPWAQQGVLLLNTVLTVRAHEPASHKGKGWELFTDAIIQLVAAKNDPVMFVLWGAHAQKKRAMIDENRHGVLISAHPSPLSARSGFLGSKPYSRINSFLLSNGYPEIDWRL